MNWSVGWNAIRRGKYDMDAHLMTHLVVYCIHGNILTLILILTDTIRALCGVLSVRGISTPVLSSSHLRRFISHGPCRGEMRWVAPPKAWAGNFTFHQRIVIRTPGMAKLLMIELAGRAIHGCARYALINGVGEKFCNERAAYGAASSVSCITPQ